MMNFLQIIQGAYKYLIQNFDLGLRNHVVRIILATFAVFVLFSGLNVFSSKSVTKIQIELIEKQFAEKHKVVMQEVLLNCEGDLYDVEVVERCKSNSLDEKLSPLKHSLIKSNFYIFLWLMLIAVVLGGYSMLLVESAKFKKSLRNKVE